MDRESSQEKEEKNAGQGTGDEELPEPDLTPHRIENHGYAGEEEEAYRPGGRQEA